jgi:alkylated DNA repair protein (DNA oxidative demethylase)
MARWPALRHDHLLEADLSAVPLAPGLTYFPGYLDRAAQQALLADVHEVIKAAPLFVPRMPRTGKPFSVRMTNCGPLGWVSDIHGYRYQPTHPDTGAPWPPMPEAARRAWEELGGYPHPAEACLVNFYDPKARMSLHQDRDEADLDAPVVSLSLGDTGLFRFGGTTRGGPTRAIELRSGDVLTFGGPSRLIFHGIARLIGGSSDLLAGGGRINLTLRRVTRPRILD